MSALDRGQVQMPDIVIGFLMLVGVIVLFPVFDEFMRLISASAGPFTSLILRLIIPAFILGLILSIGVSARRGGDAP